MVHRSRVWYRVNNIIIFVNCCFFWRFPIVYGHYFLAGAGLLSGVTINESLRRVFSLRVPVGVALAFPLSASVTVSLYALQSQVEPMKYWVLYVWVLMYFFHHKQFVTNDILLLKTPCQPCLLGRSALMQVMFGIAFPTVISAVGCGLVRKLFYPTQRPVCG